MKTAIAWIAIASALTVPLIGCHRNSSTGGEDSVQIQPGTIDEESPEWGYLSLRILSVKEKQRPLDTSPWFQAGGDWTFLECALAKQPDVRLVIGCRLGAAPKNDDRFSWGEASIAVADASVGERFVDAFAKAFHTVPLARFGQKPRLQMSMHTAVLGRALVRSPKGGFKDGSAGSWVATKWFLESAGAEAEVFFNYSMKEMRAEFAEKDEEYREDLIQQLVVGLRDGPLPERTSENDPSLTTIGPTISGWVKVANSNETCHFAHEGNSLIITRGTMGGPSQLFLGSSADSAWRNSLGEFEGMIHVEEHAVREERVTFVVTEGLNHDPKMISSSDPQRLWVITEAGKRELPTPPAVTNWFVIGPCLSPDGKFLAIGAWEGRSERVIYVTDVQSGNWQKAVLPGTLLELVGWTGDKPAGVVLTGLGIKKSEVRQAYSLDPATGGLVPLAGIPRSFIPDLKLSPDGKRSVELTGKGRLIISDAATGQQREFVFHPYDRRNVSADTIEWADNHYLVFKNDRTSLIDTETLKMNYPVSPESGIGGVEFSPNFKMALGYKSDGKYLGTVVLPKATAESN